MRHDSSQSQNMQCPARTTAKGTVMLSISGIGRLSVIAPTKADAPQPHAILPMLKGCKGPPLLSVAWRSSTHAMLASMPATRHAPDPAQLCTEHKMALVTASGET